MPELNVHHLIIGIQSLAIVSLLYIVERLIDYHHSSNRCTIELDTLIKPWPWDSPGPRLFRKEVENQSLTKLKDFHHITNFYKDMYGPEKTTINNDSPGLGTDQDQGVKGETLYQKYRNRSEGSPSIVTSVTNLALAMGCPRPG
jgi:hypothetical protein